jgi:hypothetical protein
MPPLEFALVWWAPGGVRPITGYCRPRPVVLRWYALGVILPLLLFFCGILCHPRWAEERSRPDRKYSLAHAARPARGVILPLPGCRAAHL